MSLSCSNLNKKLDKHDKQTLEIYIEKAPRFVASDLGLHCLLVTHKRDTKHIYAFNELMRA